MLSYCSSAVGQAKALFVLEPEQPNSLLPRGGCSAPLATAAFYPTLPCAHLSPHRVSPEKKTAQTLGFTKMFSVLWVTGSACYPVRETCYKDKEVRKAGSAELSVAASHKWSLIVSSKCTLTHLLA